MSFILINFFILYGTADYTEETEAPQNIWDKLWYVIEGWAYVLCALCITALNHHKQYRAVWLILALFLSIRATWEVSAVIWGVSVNEKVAMSIMFYLSAFVILCISFYPLIKKLCQKAGAFLQ